MMAGFRVNKKRALGDERGQTNGEALGNYYSVWYDPLTLQIAIVNDYEDWR